MKTDPISDFLTIVRNAVRARHKKVDVPASRVRLAIVDIMKKSGFIKDYKLFRHEQKGIIRMYLKYYEKNRPALQGLARVSKPSRRVYLQHKKLPHVLNGIGVAVVSTSKGILTDKLARENHVGGELICKIW